MTRPLKLDLPATTFDGTTASQNAARADYDPWADEMHGGILPVGFKPLPDEFVISQIQRSVQYPFIVPSGFNARVTFIANLGGYYVREMGDFVHGVEDGHPRVGMIPLHWINLWPGAGTGFLDIAPPLYGPITMRRSAGDRILVAPEATGSGSVQCFGSLLIEAQAGCAELGPDCAAGVIHTIPLNGTAPSGAPACFRSEIAVPDDAVGGTHLDVYVAAGANGLVLNSLGVGVQAVPGLPHMLAAPVPVLFDGAADLMLPPKVGQWGRATAPAGITPGCRLLFDIAMPSGTPWAFKNVARGDSWYGGTSGAASATMPGTPALQARRTHVVYAVKWFTP